LHHAHHFQAEGPWVLDYVSTHGQLGDDITFITQHVAKMNKQLRLDIQTWVFVTNLQKTSRRIRLPGLQFIKTEFDAEPEKGDVGKTSMFSLDIDGVAKCYDTAGAAGVEGSTGDVGHKPKSLSAWTWAAITVVVIGLLCLGFWGLRKKLNSFMERNSPKREQKSAPTPIIRPATGGGAGGSRIGASVAEADANKFRNGKGAQVGATGGMG